MCVYGHTKWMHDGRMAKRYLEWKPQGRRPMGRARKRGFDGVGEELERRGILLEDVEEEKMYENREPWRDLVKCLCNDK